MLKNCSKIDPELIDGLPIKAKLEIEKLRGRHFCDMQALMHLLKQERELREEQCMKVFE